MKYFKKKYFLLAFFLLFVLWFLLLTCTEKPTVDPENLIIMSWNVQNLMNGNLDGYEYDEYKPGETWDENDYLSRLKIIGKMLISFKKIPDIIVLQEVENESVVKDLVDKVLFVKGFCNYAVAREATGAISIAVISKIPIEKCIVHAVEEARPVLEADFVTKKGPLIVFAIHGASRLNGVEEAERLHLKTFKVIKQIIEYRHKTNASEAIVIVGDYNTDTSLSIDKDYEGPKALLTVKDEISYQSEEEGSLIVTGSPVMIKSNRSFWYSFWLDNCILKDSKGSYFYEKWYSFDNILCNGCLFDDTGWEFKDAGVISNGKLLKENNIPFNWDLKLKQGVSDHLPVWLEIE